MFTPIHIEIRKDKETDYPSLNYADILNCVIVSGNWENFKQNYPWLSSIDSQYGAVFNGLQRYLILLETKKLLQESYIEPVTKTLEEFLNILELAGGSYIVFEGSTDDALLSKLILKEVE